MPRRMDVGRSLRTPAKHDLMTKLYGHEIGAAHRMPDIRELLWLDLTAGDGLPSEPGREWGWSCSPGILARLARFPDRTPEAVPQAYKPVTVVLHERQPATYRKLLVALTENLPGLGYEPLGEGEWRCGPVYLVALNVDGAEANLGHIDPGTAVMVSNDPNAITDWAMPAWMPSAIRARTPWFLGLSTMGCNPAGLKRLEPEIRMGWYGHIGSMTQGLPNHHDLHLCAIERDDSQWAYLITAPRKWWAEIERDAIAAFGKHGMGLQSAWWRTGKPEFQTICDRLFKTRGELGK